MPKLLLGETSFVEPIFFSLRENEAYARKNILLTYRCKDQWAISTDNDQFVFTVFSHLIPYEEVQGYDILTYYITVIIITGMQIRYFFIYLTPRAFIYEINYPDPMLRLCESVHLCRARGDLKMEDENFRLLCDILRSQELLKLLTGSNMKGKYAPSQDENQALLIPKVYN